MSLKSAPDPARPRVRNRVGAPWSVQVELAEGCNRICSFCGITGIRERPGNYKFMTQATAATVAAQCASLAPHARYEFAMHGEPLMNPDHLAIFGLFRHYLPDAQIQLTTNGKVLMRKMQERLEKLFAAGVDFVVLDTYYPERDALREEAATLRGIKVRDFYDDLVPKGLSVYANHRRKWRNLVVLMDDIGARDGEHPSRVVMNHAGNSGYKGSPSPEPLRKTCTNPFREIAIQWDGGVNLCCMDWGNEYRCGIATARTLRQIWHGPEFQAARALLRAKDRRFGPCSRCDKGSGTRSGLLPEYDAPGPAEYEAVRRVVEGSTPQNGRSPTVLFPIVEHP